MVTEGWFSSCRFVSFKDFKMRQHRLFKQKERNTRCEVHFENLSATGFLFQKTFSFSYVLETQKMPPYWEEKWLCTEGTTRGRALGSERAVETAHARGCSSFLRGRRGVSTCDGAWSSADGGSCGRGSPSSPSALPPGRDSPQR